MTHVIITCIRAWNVKKVAKYWKVSKIYTIGTSADGEGGFFYYEMFCKQARCWLGAIYLFLTIHSSA